MRISDWSSDVCSSDLHISLPSALPRSPAGPALVSASVPSTKSVRPLFSITVKSGSAPAKCSKRARTSSSRSRSEEHTSELQSLMRISYAVFCLKKKTQHNNQNKQHQHYRQSHHIT